ncbi:YggS family pyridoxal phosphate-dependent enzyme [Capnocytophaga catalasegens]|uniref:Pyridoxal phosphate homeostasis protein n=1 Tax=Capnocytophaga catalasegens TaxID=1004260 RepID=A0AAV5AYX2_9FLAO|nr:YggS family pyridoxal phosphate-dependent enzyme [Capnocytophaga catalasegens]GIZ16463.1 YggS family pyridoxal phosphate enzyme [Capnocytophaga catalasegens]GJM50298.1 YggS family pyridoxal phosphate enzyme [Capnocytophaga catalasegens]GJM53815.1 YggS family pyridoxal phosphate enzyme [Capnocytophaga catalasegens]
MSIRENLLRIKADLGENVSLVAVSKYHSKEEIMQAYQAGQRIFGESKIQAMTEKYTHLPKDIQWHMIGHTQTNKVKYMAPYVSLIHSVDSLKLLSEINWQAQKNNRIIDFLFQIRIAQEQTKFGLSENELFSIVSSTDFQQMQHIRLRGIMGMGTNTDNQAQIKQEFLYAKSIFDMIKNNLHTNCNIDILSMGMSGDYQIAIACGSTMVRIGSAVFDKN